MSSLKLVLLLRNLEIWYRLLLKSAHYFEILTGLDPDHLAISIASDLICRLVLETYSCRKSNGIAATF